MHGVPFGRADAPILVRAGPRCQGGRPREARATAGLSSSAGRIAGMKRRRWTSRAPTVGWSWHTMRRPDAPGEPRASIGPETIRGL